MIPKKIHYCWFGRKPLPDSAKKCIASWRKYLPGYEIIEWNEDNFDVRSIPYTAQAYDAGKYAFVSDYARFKILYEHGGLYFDTDVEVIKPMDDVIARGPFMGVEIGLCGEKGYRQSEITLVAPGLGLGAFPKMKIYEDIIHHYITSKFYIADGRMETKTVGEHVTAILSEHGLRHCAEIQFIDEIAIYPPDWFNPLDDATGRLRITHNTVCIHWYAKSWIENSTPFRVWSSRMLHRIIGTKRTGQIKKIFKI